MKKILCALLCMMLVMISAESLAAVDYTLQEKMQKQLDSGSGLKGTLQLHGEGNDPFILFLMVLPFLTLSPIVLPPFVSDVPTSTATRLLLR